MDNVEEVEEALKEYDENFEIERVEAGSVVDLVVERQLPENATALMTIYVKKDLDNTYIDMDSVSYGWALKYLIGHVEGDTIEVADDKITINKIYKNLKEFNSRLSNSDKIVYPNSVVVVDHNGEEVKYVVLDQGANYDSAYYGNVRECYTNSPLGRELLGKEVGDYIQYDVAGVENNIIIKKIFHDYADYLDNSIIKKGSVVDLTIDKMNFLGYIPLDDDNNIDAKYTVIAPNTFLGSLLVGKEAGAKFQYNVAHNTCECAVNAIYPSIEQYENSNENKKVKM